MELSFFHSPRIDVTRVKVWQVDLSPSQWSKKRDAQSAD